MSMFEDTRFRWRETYFVVFHSSDRPSLETVQAALADLDEHYTLANVLEDDKGRFESLTLRSPDDFSGLDVCYTSGAEVLEQGAELADQMRASTNRPDEESIVKQVRQCDARFDVLHFEEVPELPEADDDDDDVLDPSALLLVLGALAKVTDGIAVDPQSGAILSGED
jgi:hypothetical protein